MKIKVTLVKRREPIQEFVKLGEAVEKLKYQFFKLFRIPQIAEWMHRRLFK